MPNRVIKDSICESIGLSGCSIFAQELYKRLIVYADDYGRFNADTQIMLARLFPRELDIITQDDLIFGLQELSGVGKVAFYTSKARNDVYGAFPNWGEHQRVRESKKKCPDPDDTSINDWYLQRFIPIDMRVAIIERDDFKCRICNKFITTYKDARRLVKLGTGMYHIDHIVPVQQGGRATFENLRLTCPDCNRRRKKRFDFNEIRMLARGTDISQNFAALCRNSPPESNPIQSESESEYNPRDSAGASAPATPAKGEKKKFTPPSLEEIRAYCAERGNDIDPEKFLAHYTSNGWMVGKTKMKDWKAAIVKWERSEYSDKPAKKDQHAKGASGYMGEAELAAIRRTLGEG